MLNRMARPALTPRTRTGVREIMEQVALVRVNGYALSDQELEIGLRSIAVPILDRHGRTIGPSS